MEWIQGEMFKSIVDFIYTPPTKLPGDYDNLQNTFDTGDLGERNTVYTHTMYAKQLFSVLSELPQRFVVVTHNSDDNIDGSYGLPDNVVRWFTQNVNVKNDRIESIPIGLENNMWFGNIRKKERMLLKKREPRKFKNLVYMNFNIGTNPAKRTKPYQVLKDKSWVTCQMRSNGDKFDEYIDNIYNHKFIVCPEGNGIDTHRIWEALYMGSIPIVVNNINNSFYYEKLPMLPVDDWEELSENKLNSLWESNKAHDNIWSYIILDFGYWRDKIINAFA